MRHDLNKRIRSLKLPPRIAKLKISEEGYPIPRFVARIKGKPDFRAIEPGWLAEAVRNKKCWICGEQLGRYISFVIGPMCMINRINSEPPSHLDCAHYAVQACPFLTQPRMRRNMLDLPDGYMPGNPIMRNPGVAVIWTTRSYAPFDSGSGVMFRLGDPASVEFFAEGRSAGRQEVLDSINSGMPLLREAAAHDGPDAFEQLLNHYHEAIRRVPHEHIGAEL